MTDGKKEENFKIKITNNGPYIVSGGVPLSEQSIGTDADGISVKWVQGKKYPAAETYTICRCGNSKNKPFCDGTHIITKFDGTETAGKEVYLKRADTINGPSLKLTDVHELCAMGRFCDRSLGVWELVRQSDNPNHRKVAIQEAADCPGGRLVVYDKKSGEAIEPKMEKSVSLVEDPLEGVSGPIWVKGGIPVESSDGKIYAIRNRVALCRCGKSQNKPFCDACHLMK